VIFYARPHMLIFAPIFQISCWLYVLRELRNMSNLSHVSRDHFLDEVEEGSGVGHDFHDVNFRILDDANQLTGQVKAHKLVLSLVSEIFRIQFTGSFAELNQQENGVTQAGLGKTRI
jgi:hypothetical protein